MVDLQKIQSSGESFRYNSRPTILTEGAQASRNYPKRPSSYLQYNDAPLLDSRAQPCTSYTTIEHHGTSCTKTQPSTSSDIRAQPVTSSDTRVHHLLLHLTLEYSLLLHLTLEYSPTTSSDTSVQPCTSSDTRVQPSTSSDTRVQPTTTSSDIIIQPVFPSDTRAQPCKSKVKFQYLIMTLQANVCLMKLYWPKQSCSLMLRTTWHHIA